MGNGILGQVDSGTYSSPRAKNKDSRLYMAGKTTVLIQNIAGYAVICNKIDRKVKLGKSIIYDLKENITIIYSNTRAYKIVKIEHRIPRIELDVETILTDICNVLINTLK